MIMLSKTDLFNDTKTGQLKSINIPVRGIYTEIYDDLKRILKTVDSRYFPDKVNPFTEMNMDEWLYISDHTLESESHRFINPGKRNAEAIRYIKKNWCTSDNIVIKKQYSSEFNYYISIYRIDGFYFIRLENIQISAIIVSEEMYYKCKDDYELNEDVEHKPGDVIEYADGTVVTVINTDDYLYKEETEQEPEPEPVQPEDCFFVWKKDDTETIKQQIIDTLVIYGGHYEEDDYDYFVSSGDIVFYIDPTTKQIKNTLVGTELFNVIKMFLRELKREELVDNRKYVILTDGKNDNEIVVSKKAMQEKVEELKSQFETVEAFEMVPA